MIQVADGLPIVPPSQREEGCRKLSSGNIDVSTAIHEIQATAVKAGDGETVVKVGQ